jgi:hypothetical protein
MFFLIFIAFPLPVVQVRTHHGEQCISAKSSRPGGFICREPAHRRPGAPARDGDVGPARGSPGERAVLLAVSVRRIGAGAGVRAVVEQNRLLA